MPQPTLADFFGATAAIDTSDPANPKLTMAFADFSSVGFGDAAKGNDAEAWLVAILKKARMFAAAQTDELSNITIDAPFKGLVTRNTASKREYSYQVRIYEADTSANEPDPDNV